MDTEDNNNNQGGDLPPGGIMTAVEKQREQLKKIIKDSGYPLKWFAEQWGMKPQQAFWQVNKLKKMTSLLKIEERVKETLEEVRK